MHNKDAKQWSIAKASKKNFLFTIILSVLLPITFVCFALSLRNLINSGMELDLNVLLKSGLYSFLVLVVMTLLTYLFNVNKEKYANCSIKQLGYITFSAVIRKDFPEFQKDKSARYINLLTEEMNVIRNNYIVSFFDIIKNGCLLVFALTAMLVSNWKLSILIIVLCIIPVLVSTISRNKIAWLQNESNLEEKSLISKITNILNGFLVIKSFHVEEKIEKDYRNSFSNKLFVSHKREKMVARVIAISNLSSYAVILVAFIGGLYQVIKKEAYLGDIIAVTQLVNFVVVPINELALLVNKFISGKSTLVNTLNVLNDGKKESVGENFSFSKRIEFHDVSFSYPNSKDGKKALNNINLEFERGKKYAIIGMSGSGKSTIMNLLLRFYDLSRECGEILIDGTSTNQISLESLYKNIAIIQQHVYVFDDTLKNNITLNKKYSDKEIQEAIELAGLKNLVSNNEEGLNMYCGENGALLSGGERQRLSIARSLICKTPILLLDEAMSALDKKTRFEIETALLKIQGVTTIMITHTLTEELLKQYDELIMLNKGQVIERGTFDELIQLKGDFFNLFCVEKLMV